MEQILDRPNYGDLCDADSNGVLNSKYDPAIDMSGEINALDSALSKICLLIATSESMKESPNIIDLTNSAIGIARTIKYLKSNFVDSAPVTVEGHYEDIFAGI